jgi:hypothetical protein
VTPAAIKRDWGASAALGLGIVLFFAMDQRYTLGGPAVTRAEGVVLVAIFALSVAATAFGSTKQTRAILIVGGLFFAVSTAIALLRITGMAIYEPAKIDAVRLLKTALFIWICNVVAFSVIYDLLGEGQFQFSKRAGDENVPANFADYLFVSFTTATAFSPTDTPPLTTRARMLMMAESSVSLLTIVVAAARALNML